MVEEQESYVERAVTSRLGPSDIGVKVLEGARGVGKTTLTQHLLATHAYDTYVNLADESVRAGLVADPAGFLAALPPAAILDEAQLVKDLPLRIKGVVDQIGSPRRFLLTGSASIGRTGLGGSDPLTGRVERWRLDPLTDAELVGDAEGLRSVIGRLFGAPPAERRRLAPVPADVRELVTRSGLPGIVLRGLSPAVAARRLRDWVDGVLTENVLPGERFDAASGKRLLDTLLGDSGGVLNTAAVAKRTGMDPRTVNRYLDVFERRFLLRFLPNLATNPVRQGRARSKIHPVDSAVAAESIGRADPGALAKPETVGHLFESHVVAQILAAIPLADEPVHPYYWREAGRTPREVDLVLVAESGPAVGVEVKSGQTLRPGDEKGLLALAAKRPLHAGYVVYAGTECVRLADRVWAVPLSALWEGWDRPRARRAARPAGPTPEPAGEATGVTYVPAPADDAGASAWTTTLTYR
jgi:predicted AAA+ superfamily ATPase